MSDQPDKPAPKPKAKKALNLTQKILQAKRDIGGYIKKDAAGFGFKYASPEAVLGVINPVLIDNGLLVIPRVISTTIPESLIIKKKTKKGADCFEVAVVLEMEFRIIDADTGEEMVVPWSGIGMNDGEQGFGTALTYAERYFFLKFFNLPTGADDPDSFRKKTGLVKETPPELIGDAEKAEIKLAIAAMLNESRADVAEALKRLGCPLDVAGITVKQYNANGGLPCRLIKFSIARDFGAAVETEAEGFGIDFNPCTDLAQLEAFRQHLSELAEAKDAAEGGE